MSGRYSLEELHDTVEAIVDHTRAGGLLEPVEITSDESVWRMVWRCSTTFLVAFVGVDGDVLTISLPTGATNHFLSLSPAEPAAWLVATAPGS